MRQSLGRTASGAQEALQTEAMQAVLRAFAVPGLRPTHLETPTMCRDFRSPMCPSRRKVGRMTRIVLQSGRKWGTLLSRSRSGVAGLLPLRHLGSTEPFAALDMSIGLPRHLRSLPRRQAPADGPVEAPCRVLRGRLPGGGRRPLPLAVSVHDLFGVGGRSPRGTEPALGAGAGA